MIETTSGLRIDFGRTQESTIPAVTRLLGAKPTFVRTNSECGAGPLDIATWEAGLTLLFQNGDFRGWLADSTTVPTTNGLRVGQGVDTVISSGGGVRPSTLGDEFVLDGIFGLLSEKNRITQLWAGTTCFFR